MLNIYLDKNVLNALDMSFYSKDIPWDLQFFQHGCGKEHYRLLMYLASCLKGPEPMIDIGTYKGLSAAALGADSEQKVITYDIANYIPDNDVVKKMSNIEFRIANCCNEMDTICSSKLLFIDIDPHDGIEDAKIFKLLVENGFKGLLVIDDIHHFEGMRNFFDSITLQKYDVTAYGHWSGTGIVNFDPDSYMIVRQ